MKKNKFVFTAAVFAAFVLTAFLFGSCKKHGSGNETDTKPGQPGQVIIAPAGIPDGSPVSEAVIGTAGGSIASVDGNLRVDVPAGAVDANTTFTITRITNTNPAAHDSAYRITPHDANFKKKLKITMKYTDASFLAVPGISYQNQKGEWIGTRDVVHDKTKQTISFATDHFSDWTIFHVIHLVPESKMLDAGTSFELHAEILDDFLQPLDVKGERPITLPTKNIRKYIKKWSLQGAGELNDRGEYANYHAPDNAANGTEATVALELDLHNGEQHIILCNITIQNSGITIRDGRGPARTIQGFALTMGNDIVVINGGNQETGRNEIVITWTGGKGKYSFNDGITQFLYMPTANDIYVHYYKAGEELVPSGGYVKVTDLGMDDGYIKGEFLVEPAGHGTLNSDPVRYGTISGAFKVKKRKA